MNRLRLEEINNIKQHTLTKDEINNLWLSSVNSIDKKIIVLDDDPTGTQTVHSVPVYTSWDYKSIEEAFKDKSKVVYILTNSRAFTSYETERVHKNIAIDLVSVSKKLRKEFILISRGDSTLRGHYPLETQTLYSVLNKSKKIDGEIIIPFFLEGGRFTINDIHYVKTNNELIPAGETEFAQDTTFGYKSSDLKDWIEEKTNGKYKAKDVISITLDEIREYKKKDILIKLKKVDNFSKIIVNAISYDDIKIFTSVLTEVLGYKNYIFRLAASFVKVIGGIKNRNLLEFKNNSNSGGLVVVGSYVKKTTEQLNELLKIKSLKSIPFDVTKAYDNDAFSQYIKEVSVKVNGHISKGEDVCLYTAKGRKREFVSSNNKDEESDLKLSVKISDGLVDVVKRITTKPAFIVAKGGITSSDIAVKAINIKKAKVLGQIFPGIPVWKVESENIFKDIPYIVFPGNVGEKDTLQKIVLKFVRR